jgi:hypothetical protein
LTPRGRELDGQTEGTIEAAVSRALGHVSELEVAAAKKLLGKLSEALELEVSAVEARAARRRRARG